MISANNITLRVGKKALFEDVNIKFTEGNCYGLIGANGAGKSTFLKILSGQLEPTKGDIVITPGQRLSFLQQDHFKYDAYPVLDTVIMGNERLYQIMKEKERGASGYTGTGSGGYGDTGSGYGGFGGFGPFGGFYGQYTNQNQQTTETEEDIHLRAAANYLNSGHYKEALNVLSGIKDRSARWYYYSSIANSGMGNNVLALEHAKEALRLEPSNYQYQSLVSRLENGGSWYRTQQTMYGGTPTINNDFCVKLCIANLMCNLCCGGGGFFCGSPYTYH